ncbi:MAG: MoaD/ThiS family protein [Thermoanaerobacteraceae bacterium]|nr:MoaD/ThiS family protein [Thermoanaerobacteraceae bacterium]
MVTVNGKEIDFKGGMTVADVLRAAGETPNAWTLVVVDEKVISPDLLSQTPVADGAEIRLLPLLSGG